ncbi:lipocalin-like domain-containing protein [Cellulophaga tyrosinoxydans]|uniref:Lipocalin-like domain-containing protein n=1 Tax=Cellulophaga tyrosinoxydans TaxID=504486 RepID=A0A1W2BIC9_9FLAO|nr:lipocalin family protein [Cellulophaga tyrosinoxydans]SMC72442.1 Lipocalin-like domain-containing protein [Cellulophaga tyrosinoxydans]|tara:strand:- start:117 stop:596 length:480 start_codon:yes stop_codon:yes gene_type:complete
MKKTVVLSLLISLLFMSCSSTKAIREKRNLFSGTWILNNVSFEGQPGTFKAVLFNDASDACFEGSNWFFRDNNSTGRYTLDQTASCNGGDRFFRWSVIENDYGTSQLQFKAIDEKRKDISSGYGYRLDITSLTETSMTLKSKVTENGSPISVVYEFIKQ